MNKIFEKFKHQKRKFLLRKQFKRLTHNPVPWLVPSSVKFIENWMEKRSDLEAVEFGGGSSTLWFLQRVSKLHTHEANANWASLLLEYMSGKPELASKWRLNFVNCDWNIDEFDNRWYIKNGHESTSDRTKFDMESDFIKTTVYKPDIILNDGSIRAKTLMVAVELLQNVENEALLVVDNTEKEWRDRYTRKLIPQSWERIDFINEAPDYVNWVERGSRTTIWKKPGLKNKYKKH
jgi:hypothetical protein